MKILKETLKAHLLLFDQSKLTLSTNQSLVRYSVAFLISGVFLLWAVRQLVTLVEIDFPLGDRFLISLILLLSSLVVVRLVVKKDWSYIGFRGWSKWTRREKLYAIQVIPLAVVVFGFVFQDLFRGLISENGLIGFLLVNLLFGIIWGFYQEFAYRGVLQTLLTSKFGPWIGVFTANLIFTFGPLHWSIYGRITEDFSAIMIFVPIFAIGLAFGLIYHRSGNIWLPAILHGLWPLNMVG